VQSGRSVGLKDYRCPDAMIYLRGNPAQNRGTHWYGGPDVAVEIVSPGDRSYEKLDFYAAVNTREVLIVDRKPWVLTLFRIQNGAMVEVGLLFPEHIRTQLPVADDRQAEGPLRFIAREADGGVEHTL
jgi:Uma2 family endonuclease